MIRIHNFGPARGMRIVWQCEEMGLPYELVPVPFPPDAAYRAINPIGAVPFLEDEGGVAINESVAIMLYLAEQYGPTPLLPRKGEPDLARVLQFTIFGEATLGMHGNVINGARLAAPEAEKQNWSVRNSTGRFDAGLAFVADKLGAGPYIAGERFTLADISVGFVLSIARRIPELGIVLPEGLTDYRDRLEARPAYQRAIAG